MKIEVNGKVVRVKIYKTRSSMRRAIKRWGYDSSNTESVVIPVEVYALKKGKWRKTNEVAELLTYQDVSMPVLVHESLHVATTIVRRTTKKPIELGNKITFIEELLAHTQTAVLQEILTKFFPKTNSSYDYTDIEIWAKESSKNNKRHGSTRRN